MLVESVSQFVSSASERKKSSDQKSGSIGNHHFCSSFTWYVWFSPIRSISQQNLDHQPLRRVRCWFGFHRENSLSFIEISPKRYLRERHRTGISKVSLGYAHGCVFMSRLPQLNPIVKSLIQNFDRPAPKSVWRPNGQSGDRGRLTWCKTTWNRS